MSNQEYLEFLDALRRLDAEFLTTPEKARELLEDEGALEHHGPAEASVPHRA